MVRIACGSLCTFATAALIMSVWLILDEFKPSGEAGEHEEGWCHDDPAWSAYGGGLYTCAWLEKFDPGCRANPCGSAADFGQCRACPHACHRCAFAPVAPPPLPPLPPPSPSPPLVMFDAARNVTSAASEPDAGLDAELATIAFTVGALLAAAALGLAVGILEQRSDGNSLLMARRLAFALVGVYLLVGYLAVRVMNIAPERCIVAYQRIVPYTRASAELGEVIRFRYSQTHEVYVVLITEHSFDLFARSCSPYSLCLSLGFFGLFLHLAVARGLQTRTRETRRQQKILERVIDARNVTTIAQLRVVAAAQAAALCSDQLPDSTPAHDDAQGAAAPAPAPAPAPPAPAPAEVDQTSSTLTAIGPTYLHSFQGEAFSPRAWTEAPECPICLEAYEENEEIIVLPCRHMLHRACLLSWTRARMISTSCPLCKAPLLPDGVMIDDECEMPRCCLIVHQILVSAPFAPLPEARPSAGTAMV
jgi:hypothetical protein